ncbi:MAG TPA: cupredoxin domain-containing protein [Halothiobacillaceae bacterium]|nr:cupredoxin domain-containing protein [Halothiobacillaceae bacterium]
MVRIAFPLAFAALVAAGAAQAETMAIDLAIKDHRFQPETVTIPAGEKVKLMVHNQDATPEEFESYELNREKIIPGNSKAVVFVGPLDPGEYPFFGEFNQDTAQGRVVVE